MGRQGAAHRDQGSDPARRHQRSDGASDEGRADQAREILTAEGDRAAAILRAEGAKQSAILEAEGAREAAFRDAEARERTAEAEAKATEVVSDAISKGDVNAIRYFLGLKYVEAFGQLATSNQQRTVIILGGPFRHCRLGRRLARALNAQSGDGTGPGPWIGATRANLGAALDFCTRA